MGDSDERDLIDKINQSQLRDDVQEFQQVYNLGGVSLGSVTVGYVWTGNFIARCEVRRPEGKRGRKIMVFADSRSGALEALASAVAEFLYPSKGKK